MSSKQTDNNQIFNYYNQILAWNSLTGIGAMISEDTYAEIVHEKLSHPLVIRRLEKMGMLKSAKKIQINDSNKGILFGQVLYFFWVPISISYVVFLICHYFVRIVNFLT